MIDDAHGIGVMGKHGRGTAEYYGLEIRLILSLVHLVNHLLV